MVFAMVGMEDIWAYPRFGYTVELQRGFTFVPALIGLFGLAEVFMVLKQKNPYQILGEGGWVLVNVKLIGKYFATILRSVLIAVGIGIVPGVVESAACWVGYDAARRRSKNKANFGKGEIEGVIASEAANSATSGGALIPTPADDRTSRIRGGDRGLVLDVGHLYSFVRHFDLALVHPHFVQPAGSLAAGGGGPGRARCLGGWIYPV